MHRKLIYVMPNRIIPDHFGHSHEQPGNIEVGDPQERLVSEMMGSGGVIKPEEVDAQVTAFVAGGLDPVVARAFCDGIACGSLTEDQALARIQAKDKPPGTLETHILEETQVPADHACDAACEFFNAWEWTDGITVNMPKARTIHMNRIRLVRNSELVKLDGPWLKATDTGNTAEQQRIAALKQALRDIPQTFKLSNYRSPVTLKAAWPPQLPRPVVSGVET